MIFSRRSRAGRDGKAEVAKGGSDSAARRTAPRDEVDLAPAPAPVEETGPYDLSEAPAGLRIDLGSLQIPAIDGVEIRAQAGEDGLIQQLEVSHGANALQLGVFAAPRTIQRSRLNTRCGLRRALLERRIRTQTPDGCT